MKVLIDTHVLLWFITDESRLPQGVMSYWIRGIRCL